MSSKRAKRRRSCEGKRSYSNQTEAVAVIIRMKKDKVYFDNRLHSYKCPFCGQFHLGRRKSYRGPC